MNGFLPQTKYGSNEYHCFNTSKLKGTLSLGSDICGDNFVTRCCILPLSQQNNYLNKGKRMIFIYAANTA